MGLLYGLILLVIFFVTGIILFIFSIKRHSKIGIIFSLIMIAVSILILFTNKIDERTITKNDVTSDLKYLNIELKDNFKITRNKVTGMPERIQETEIQISEKDRNRIIKEISNSTNFKSFTNNQELLKYKNTERFNNNDKILNFKYPDFYSREIYTKIDNYPTRLFVKLNDKSDTIKYQRIED
ncbi:hypothetical protein IH575_01730 [Candidatus Dojkabacteria bacterium]|nr:hypothetical protein [Candidatus Dojkabacteria bacterium]